MDFRFLFIGMVGLVVVCNTAPSPPSDIDEDVASRYGVQGINQNNQNHRNPDTPRAPHQDPGRGCRWEYETKYEVKNVETTDQKCHVEYETKCTTRSREKCTPYTDRVCTTQYRQKCRNWTEKKCTDSWRNECSTRTKEECNEYNEPIDVPYTEDKCSTRTERKCEKHWEEPIKGKKVWVDNPATCKNYDVTDCQPVTSYKKEFQKQVKCKQVPYQHCDRVKDTNCRDVPKQQCQDVPYQDCHNEQKQRCEPESWQDCNDIPRQKCQTVHKQTPQQVAKQIRIRVCGDRREPYNEGGQFGQFDGSDVFDIRNGNDDNHDPKNDAETIQFGQQKEKIDPGLFEQKVKDVVLEKSEPEEESEDGNDKISFGKK